MWRSVSGFVWTALRPVGKWWDVVIDLAGLAVFGGVGAWIGQNPSWAGAGVALGLAVLFLVAGVRLQFEKQEHERIRFTVSSDIVPIPHVHALSEASYSDNTYLLVEVRNDGPTADFVARIRDVDGARRTNGGAVEVHEVAWEHGIEKRYPIERGGKGRLKIANVARHPVFAMWFWTAKTHTYGADESHAVGARLFDVDYAVSFLLDVYNVKEDQSLLTRCVLLFDENRAIVGFEVVPLANQEAISS